MLWVSDTTVLNDSGSDFRDRAIGATGAVLGVAADVRGVHVRARCLFLHQTNR